MATILMVGLGSGDERQLTLGVYETLRGASALFMRTEQHPVAAFLRAQGIEWQSFDAVYEQHESFDAVYEEIVRRLLTAAQTTEGTVVYAVPGHPAVAERTALLLQERCVPAGVAFDRMGGESFLDQVFLRFGFDPVEGFQLLDGTALTVDQLNPTMHTVVAQIYDSFVASDVKLTLLDMYPPDYEVWVGHALGVAGAERIERLPLLELDRRNDFGNLSVLWCPRTEDERLHYRTFGKLREIVERLRSPGGCPWDQAQTHRSIRKNLIEETCEVLDALDRDEPLELQEEMGDLMLQIMLHSQMEAEIGQFTVHDVLQSINEKLIRRHPHVFGTGQADDADEALQNWQAIKAEEKRQKGIDPSAQSLLAGLPRELTSLLRALKLQKKAAEVGFDWPTYREVWAKVLEELDELREAVEAGEAAAQRDEFGDVLFALVNAARFLKIDPEDALAATNLKFERRFAFIEQQLRARGLSFAETNLQQMDEFWEMAKKNV